MQIENDKLTTKEKIALYVSLKKALDNRMDYPSEKQALAAIKKVPKDLRQYAVARECISVSLGLGWI